ncbi:uncharacterized protein LOC132181884 [Corylus avellana]|uniref:uncharacterized protein LOC132181884 n=1 Tax=Corylus avellana TaxID=13451 RepID=UPI00286B52A1|nr:uncharacterized protein LOC132181884 [Corylus avellana]
MRSLPAKFIPQIAAIQQSKDLEKMRVEELVGSLQTFELLLTQSKTSKNVALKIKTPKEKSRDSSSKDSGDDEKIALIVWKFRKFVKPRSENFKGKDHKKPVNARHEGRENSQDRNVFDQKDKVPRGRKCHECGDNDDSEEDEEENVNYLAFTASYGNQSYTSGVQDVSEYESDNEYDLQTAYNQMFQEFNNLCDKIFFKELKKGRNGNITYGDGSKSKVIGQGIVEVPGVASPQDVLYVEGLKANLLSISQFCDNDLVVQFSKKECSIFDAQGKWLMGGDRTSDNCYGISPTMQTKCQKVSLDIGELWHQRLGHLNYHDLVKIAKKEAINHLPKINYLEKGKCGPC